MIYGMRKIAVLAFAAAAVLAACNNSSSTAVPPAGGGTSGGSGSSSNGQIETTNISGLGMVLEAPTGLTLYHLTSEDKGTISCTASCIGTWPPLLAPGGQAPTSMGSLPKTFGTIKRPDGTVQATYDGFPLYTYSGDSGTGQANGNGIPGQGGTWYAVTPTGTTPAGTGGTGGTGGGYGGGGGGGY